MLEKGNDFQAGQLLLNSTIVNQECLCAFQRFQAVSHRSANYRDLARLTVASFMSLQKKGGKTASVREERIRRGGWIECHSLERLTSWSSACAGGGSCAPCVLFRSEKRQDAPAVSRQKYDRVRLSISKDAILVRIYCRVSCRNCIGKSCSCSFVCVSCMQRPQFRQRWGGPNNGRREGGKGRGVVQEYHHGRRRRLHLYWRKTRRKEPCALQIGQAFICSAQSEQQS